MKKLILYMLVFILLSQVSFNQIESKTIWIIDNTNNHESINRFIKIIKNELDLTEYSNRINYVTNNSQIKEDWGDLVIELNGYSTSTNTGNITYFSFIFCLVPFDCQRKLWYYIDGRNGIFSDEFIYKHWTVPQKVDKN